MTYIFKPIPPNNNVDGLISTALTGVVYTENNRLHIKTNNMHYVYKFDGSPVGWYARNPKTLDDIYLGISASPTAELETISIQDEIYWESLLYVEPTEEEIALEKQRLLENNL